MWNRLLRKRDFYSGCLVILLGLLLVVKAPSYQIGTLAHMGPGFMPMALGIVLIGLGVLISAAAETGEDTAIEPNHGSSLQWRGWLCILSGPILFILLGNRSGMVPATFACVFVSALGDREANVRSAIILAGIITAFSAAVFSYFLQIPMPLFQWRGL